MVSTYNLRNRIVKGSTSKLTFLKSRMPFKRKKRAYFDHPLVLKHMNVELLIRKHAFHILGRLSEPPRETMGTISDEGK